LPYIVSALESMQSWTMNTTGHEARALLNSLLKADFLMGLVCLRKLSALLRPVSLGLQQENADLVQALDDVNDVIAVLSRWRDEA